MGLWTGTVEQSVFLLPEQWVPNDSYLNPFMADLNGNFNPDF